MPRPKPIGSKKCPKCKTSKCLDEFYKSEKYDGGYSSYCKDCQVIINKENRNPSRDNSRRKRLYANNPEPLREKSREYLAKLKSENPAKLRAKKFFDVKRDGVADDVTRSFVEGLFLTVKNCQCCGKTLDLKYPDREGRKYRSNKNSPSIDRVDNGKGYIRGNIAVICWECNYRKTDLTREDLLMMLSYIKRCSNV